MKTISNSSISQVFTSDINTRKVWNSYNIISRTEQSVKFQEKINHEIENQSYLKPISDFSIIKNIENFQFPHPQLLISFLTMHRPSSKTKIKEILIPYLLMPNFTITNIISAIADSLSLNSAHLLQHFTSNLNCHKAKEEWENRFKGIPINTNLKITEKWSLTTLDDLQSLHLLACSINCKIYLLFNIEFPIVDNENTLFSTIVGPSSDSTFCTFFLCESPTTFIYAKPMTFSKQIRHFHTNFPSLKRLTLPSKKYAIYLNFPQLLKVISLNGSIFNSISTHFIVDPTISEPILTFTFSTSLKIEIRHPNDDYSYCELLEKLEHISSSFSSTEPAIMDDHFKFNLKFNENQKVKIHSNSLITVHSIKENKIELNKLCKITKISEIDQLSYALNSLNFPPLTKSSDLKLFQMIRFLFPFITKYKTYQTTQIETSPIITTHTDDFSLSNASNHPYSHFLCLYSIFNAATKSRNVTCKKCHKNRADEERKEVVMIPVRTVSNNSLSSPFISWICIDCFKRLNSREKMTIKGQFPMFHEVVDVDNLTRIQSPHNMFVALKETEERIHMSIMSIKSQPIGALRAIVPRIDTAFNELIEILKLFRQRQARLIDVSADDLATIRNSDEYKARIGVEQRAVKVDEPDFEVVDYEMFKRYLEGFTEKSAGTTEYLLTQPLSDIKEAISEEAVQKMQEICTTISAKIESIEVKYSNQNKETNQNENNNNDNENNQNDNDNENNNDNDNDTVEHIFNNEIERGNLCFDVDIKCENDEIQCISMKTNVYDVHVAENGNFVTSMPIITIKTRKFLNGVSFYKESELILIVSDDKTATTELYIVPLSDLNLDILSDVQDPCLIIDGISDCEVSFSSDGTSIALLGTGSDENPLYIVTYNDDESTWHSEHIGTFPATKIAFLLCDDCSLFTANDDFFCVLKFGLNDDEEEEEAPIVNMKKHRGNLVKLIPSSESVWALFDSGDCLLLRSSNNNNEEEEEAVENEENDDDDDSHLRFMSDGKFIDGFLSSENGEVGITAVDDKGRFFFKPSPSHIFRPSVNVEPSFGHRTYNFPSGVFELSNCVDSSGFSVSQIALSFVEMFPVLVGHFYRSSFFLIGDKLKSYRPQTRSKLLSNSIRSFCTSEMTHTSLHHIEKALLLSENLKVKIVTFIDFGLQNSSSFIDSIFGTTFTFCEADGVWIGARTVNGFVYLIVFVKVSPGEKKCQILLDASISALISLNKNQKNVFFLTQNEMSLFDTLTNINKCNVLHSNKFNACAIVFVRNSKQRIFEFKTIEASLKNIIQNVNIDSMQLELFDDYSELMINPADGSEIDHDGQIFTSNLRKDWIKILDDIIPIDIDTGIENIKKMVSLMATLYQFQDIEPLSVINNCI